MDKLVFSRSEADELVAHAREELPNECCGILGGADGKVSKVYRATNLDKSPVKFTIDPMDTLSIYKDSDESGIDLLAYYHSHVATEAYPSVTDVKLVGWPDYLYVIVSLADRENPVTRAFRIVEQQVDEVPIDIVG